MAGLIAVNGEVFSPEKAAVSALDRGFLYGDNIFEVFVCFHHKVLDLGRHLTRLRSSAEGVGIAIPWSDEELSFELTSLAEQLPEAKKYLRLMITRGEGLSLRSSHDLKPNKIVYCFKAVEDAREVYQHGLALKRMRLSTTERGAAAKTGNYLRSILALQKAEQEGFQDVLWSNGESEITEATTSNVFFLERRGDHVEFVTPAPLSGILLGITRETLIRLMTQAKIPVAERIIYADELARFDEGFLCSTVRGIVPINRIDSHKLHTTRPNSVSQHITRLYMAWVRSELGFPVDWITGRRLTDT